ncbi:MAG TPA: radical SAM protein, partial [Dongiaceae bacterium]|nr:radical SAM protein [Dongiaceae bacterium]
FGIESGDEHIRNAVLKKAISDDEICRGAAILKKNGITFRTYNIVGFPGETIEQALKTVQLNVAIGTDFPWCSIFMPYPGTRLADYARNRGFLASDLSPDSMEGSFHITSALTNPDRRQLANLHKFFQTAVLMPPLLPVIRLLIKLPENFLFRIWFGIVYFHLYQRSEGRGFIKTFRAALRNGRFFKKR